ncbi:mechanosensitive ion channel family protein [Nocardioides sp. GY 10113]|uniref:mechanosensitive ion channel family protein n=1 Tax=Nocardioides sp. GY 10113 TaxID=2569761 RepID=UPI00197F596F|nr:mechanosensitive ion channel family protein [Nocardioides sp. GY 10113]
MEEPNVHLLAAATVALAIAVAVIAATRVGIGLLARRWPPASRLAESARIPFRALVALVALSPVLADLDAGYDLPGWATVDGGARVAMVFAAGWLLTVVLVFLVDLALLRNAAGVARADNRAARRLRTQVMILRRLVYVAGAVVTVGAVLLSIPGVEAYGASVLASAGVISVVAGLAATSVLGNVFAGLQLAFSDAIRLDDAVIVEGEWGWIDELTLTYVVVRLWDERRMVLPSSYFTTTPFQNWTRESAELLGSVELDLDWRVDTAALRAEVDRALEVTDLWDGRAKVVQVTDAVGGYVRVRVLVTARDAPTLFDLRCHVREHLVAWVRENAERGMPRLRTEIVEAPRSRVHTPRTDVGGLFHGDEAAEERAARATGEIDLRAVGDADRPADADLGDLRPRQPASR